MHDRIPATSLPSAFPSTRSRLRRAATLAAGSAVLVASLGACGGRSSLTKAPTGNEMTITAFTTPREMGYRVSGKLRPGYATITFKDEGPELHMIAVARVKPEVTADQIKFALSKDQADLTRLFVDDPSKTSYGTPTLLSPGQSTTVTSVDLKAGRYAILCFVPDEDGKPHALKGMLDTFDVAGDAFETSPETTGTITVQDERFLLPPGFKGRGTYLVTNSGTVAHTFDVVRLDGGTTPAAYLKHVNDAFSANKPPNGGGGTIVGGIDELQPGQSAYVTLNLKKGRYAYLSTNGGDEPNTTPDVAKGLVGEFTVS